MTGPPLRPPPTLVFRNPNPHAPGSLLELTQDLRDASCWTIFVRHSDGLANAVGDFTSRERALEILQLLFGELKPIPDPITRWS